MVWYSHLFKNFPQFVVIHTVKGFSIVSEAEVDVFFWNSLAFSMIQWMSFPTPGDLPNQGSNPGPPHCRWILYQLSHQESLFIIGFLLNNPKLEATQVSFSG